MRYLLISFILTAALSLMADPIYWPVSPRIPFKTSESWMPCEAGQTRNLRINMGAHHLDLPYLGKFAIASNDPHWNATLALPEESSIRCGITALDRSTWMGELSADTIKKYLEGLKIKGYSNIRSSIDDSYHDDVIMLDKKPEIVGYEVGNIERLEYFIESGPYIIVLTYEAPTDIFSARQEMARLIFARTIMR